MQAQRSRNRPGRPAGFSLIELPVVRKRKPTGFSLIELLVVIAVIALLVTMLAPSLRAAKDMAREAVCQTRVAAQLKGVHVYAADHDGLMPNGPSSPMPFMPIPCNRIANNQIWIGSLRTFNAHGALLGARILAPEVFWCPDDDSANPKREVEKVYRRQDEDSYCSYFYRQLDGQADEPPSHSLVRPGKNSRGSQIAALILDANSRMNGFWQRTNHRGWRVSVGFIEGHTEMFDTPHEELSLRPGDERDFLTRLDEILEHSDALGR